MTFWGGRIADGGFDTAGNGRGVEICGREDSLLLVNDFRRDFMMRELEGDRIVCSVLLSITCSFHKCSPHTAVVTSNSSSIVRYGRKKTTKSV